jgi:hypothetical protein
LVSCAMALAEAKAAATRATRSVMFFMWVPLK